MKILVLTFYYKPDLCAGSFRSTAFIQELRKKLLSTDTIDIVTTMPNRYHSYSESASEYEEDGNVRIRRIPLPKHESGMIDQSKAFYYFARSALRHTKSHQYDLVFSTSSRLFTAVLGAFIAQRFSAKLYLDIRDIFTDTLNDVLNPWASKVIVPPLRYVEAYAVKKASRVNLVSKGFESYFNNKYKSLSYSFYSNGIDPEFLNYDFSKQHDSDQKIILYAGNIGAGQGLDKIIPQLSLAMGSKFEFWIVGGGSSLSQLEKILNKSPVNVKLMPPVGRSQLLKLYKQSDCLLLHLNDYDAFKKVLPSKIFEYAATGKPILAGVAGYASKFIQENVSNAAVFNPCDVKDAVNKLSALDMSENPRNKFINKFRRENIMRDMATDLMALQEQK